MRKNSVRTVKRAQTAGPGQAARRVKEALKYSKEKVYQDEPTSRMVLNSSSIDS
jgi:hypothetical protein